MAILSGDYVVVKLDDAGGTPRTFANGDIIDVDVPMNYDQNDITGYGNDAQNVVNGQLTTPVKIRGYFSTTALVGTHTVIRDAYQQRKQVSLEVQIGQNATPTTGDPKFTGEYYIESYAPVLETGKTVTFEATLKSAGNVLPAWGTI